MRSIIANKLPGAEIKQVMYMPPSMAKIEAAKHIPGGVELITEQGTYVVHPAHEVLIDEVPTAKVHLFYIDKSEEVTLESERAEVLKEIQQEVYRHSRNPEYKIRSIMLKVRVKSGNKIIEKGVTVDNELKTVYRSVGRVKLQDIIIEAEFHDDDEGGRRLFHAVRYPRSKVAQAYCFLDLVFGTYDPTPDRAHHRDKVQKFFSPVYWRGDI